MEKLSTSQQQQVKKMSDERLHVKLIAAGYEEDVVLGYERDDLLSSYAEVLASGKVKAGPVAYDPEIEREKLIFEQRKWEAEMEEKKRKEEVEQQRWEAELEEKRRREWLEAEQLELRKRELQRQEMRDRAEDERRESAVVKGKLFGDAMRASAIRMGADPIDAIPFFRNVEQLFTVYNVPSSLQAVLIRPFLNDRAKVILGKLSPEFL